MIAYGKRVKGLSQRIPVFLESCWVVYGFLLIDQVLYWKLNFIS